jgi:hypothetical protein
VVAAVRCDVARALPATRAKSTSVEAMSLLITPPWTNYITRLYVGMRATS